MPNIKILVYIHRNIFYDHDKAHNATASDAIEYLKQQGEDLDLWSVMSFAVFDMKLNNGDITPDTPVYFITQPTIKGE